MLVIYVLWRLVCLVIHLFVYVCVGFSVCLVIHLFVFFLFASVCLCLCLFAHTSICLYRCLFPCMIIPVWSVYVFCLFV